MAFWLAAGGTSEKGQVRRPLPKLSQGVSGRMSRTVRDKGGGKHCVRLSITRKTSRGRGLIGAGLQSPPTNRVGRRTSQGNESLS